MPTITLPCVGGPLDGERFKLPADAEGRPTVRRITTVHRVTMPALETFIDHLLPRNAYPSGPVSFESHAYRAHRIGFAHGEQGRIVEVWLLVPEGALPHPGDVVARLAEHYDPHHED